MIRCGVVGFGCRYPSGQRRRVVQLSGGLEAQCGCRSRGDDDVELVDRLLGGGGRGGVVAGLETWLSIAALHPMRSTVRHPQLTVTSITPFGLDGPWRDRAATEFTLQAWSGGIVGLGRGRPERAPVFVGGQVGEYLAGAYASAATLASRYRRIAGGGRRTHGPVDAGDPDPGPDATTRSPTSRCSGGPGETPGGSRCRASRRPRTAWWTSGAVPRSSGSTCARWWVTRSGSTRNRRCRSPSRPTFTPTRSMRGSRQHGRRDPRARNGFPDSQRAGGQRRQHRVAGPLRGSAARLSRNPRDGFQQPGHALPDAARTAAAAAAGTAARGAHRRITGPRGRSRGPAADRCRETDCRSAAFGCWT